MIAIDKPQAEAVAAAVQDATESAEFVTKRDLAEAFAELRAGTGELRAEFRSEIAALRSEMQVGLRELELRMAARMDALQNRLIGPILGAMLAAVKMLGH